jgi:hypothetical protein
MAFYYVMGGIALFVIWIGYYTIRFLQEVRYGANSSHMPEVPREKHDQEKTMHDL